MKLVNYKVKNHSDPFRIGFIVDDGVYDIQTSYRSFLDHNGINNPDLPADPSAFFSQGLEAIEKAQKAYQYININSLHKLHIYKAEEVIFGPPNPKPEKIICVGLNYADHVKEMHNEIQEYPVLFSKFNNSLIGPHDPIEKTPLTNQLDYEVELVVVIGKEASKVKQKDAYQYIAGYTIGNDISARDLQKRTPQWLQGKSLDQSTPIGPWVVSADEISNLEDMNIRSFVNEELRQQSNTRHFIFNIPYLIEFISHLITLKPGDLIFTGTPDGVGMGMNPPRFLNVGDTVTLEIDGIGVLENKIVEQQ